MLSKKAIEAFEAIYQKECGIKLSKVEASEKAEKFIELIKKILVKNHLKEQNGVKYND